MPRKKSAKKDQRKSEKRRLRNLKIKTKIKKAIKEIKKLIQQKEIEKAKAALPEFYKILDKAAKAGVLKENSAARKKSKIARVISKLERQKEK